MDNWSIKWSGKVQLLVIYFVTLLLMYWAFFSHSTRRYGGELEDNMLFGLVLLLPITIAALILPPKWILQKKTAKRISIDSQNNVFNLEYFNNRPHSNSLELTAYTIYHHNWYSVLIFYKKFKATRGHYVYKELPSIIATKLSMSWEISTLKRIGNRMEEIGMEHHSPKKEKNFWVYITE